MEIVRDGTSGCKAGDGEKMSNARCNIMTTIAAGRGTGDGGRLKINEAYSSTFDANEGNANVANVVSIERRFEMGGGARRSGRIMNGMGGRDGRRERIWRKRVRGRTCGRQRERRGQSTRGEWREAERDIRHADNVRTE